ncbi:MAG: anti-sigma factor, partial [Pollutimonas bauzanensis]
MSGTQTSDRGILIAEYTLGLLNLQETSQAQALLGEDGQAAIAALQWENSFLDLVDLLPPVDPGPQSLRQLQATLGHAPVPAPAPAASTRTGAQRFAPLHGGGAKIEPSLSPSPSPSPPAARAPDPAKPEYETLTVAAALRTREKPIENHQAPAQAVPAAASARPPRVKAADAGAAAQPRNHAPAAAKAGNIWLWRIASLVFALIALTLSLMPAKPVAPPVTVVELAPTRAAIMQAPGQSSTPGWVVTVDPQGNVLMNPQVRSDIPADASVQLWTHNKNMPQPRSLGLIDPNQPVTVPANLMGEISPDQIFEMTQEPAGGAPSASPTGPILFIGRIVTFGRPALAAPGGGPGTGPGPATGPNQPAANP